MSTEFNFSHAETSFFAAVSKSILCNPLPDETPSSRMKQIALMGIIYQLKASGHETTIGLVMEVTGLPRTSMTKFMQPLLERGLLTERSVLNSAGKGRAYVLDIPSAFLSKLNPFIRTL